MGPCSVQEAKRTAPGFGADAPRFTLQSDDTPDMEGDVLLLDPWSQDVMGTAARAVLPSTPGFAAARRVEGTGQIDLQAGFGARDANRCRAPHGSFFVSVAEHLQVMHVHYPPPQ